MMNERESQHRTDEEHAGGGLGGLTTIKPEEALETIANVAREHPHAALAGAFAVGFVLGGGLTPRLVGAGVMLFARRYLQTALRESVDSFMQEAKTG